MFWLILHEKSGSEISCILVIMTILWLRKLLITPLPVDVRLRFLFDGDYEEFKKTLVQVGRNTASEIHKKSGSVGRP